MKKFIENKFQQEIKDEIEAIWKNEKNILKQNDV
jgi:hypothetical protein